MKSFLEFGRNGRTSDVFLGSILPVLNGLDIVTCPFNEAQLLDVNLRIEDVAQMYTVFGFSWNLVDREVRRNGIKKVGKANYMQALNLPYYQRLDVNIKSAIRELIARI